MRDDAHDLILATDSIVSVNEGGRAGVTGTLWQDGLVVTAEHTIRDQQDLSIELPDDGSSTATVVGRDPTTDVALLRLKENVPATKWHRSSGASTTARPVVLFHEFTKSYFSVQSSRYHANYPTPLRIFSVIRT
jgi:hypothetical protein